jgi:hypothetical protein
MSTQQKLLEQLQLEHDQRLLEQSLTAVPTPDSTIKVTPIPTIDLVGEVDELIIQRQSEMNRFTSLAPQYNILAQKVEESRSAYDHLLSKYSEAQVKVTAVQAANFIQIIKPAYGAVGATSSLPKLAILAFAGSLGLGVMLAFLLDYLFSFKTKKVIVPESDVNTPPQKKRAGRKTHSKGSEQESLVKDQNESKGKPALG